MDDKLLALMALTKMAGLSVDTLNHVPSPLKRVYGEDFSLLQADILDQMENMIAIDKAMTKMFSQMTTSEAEQTKAEIKRLGQEGIALISKRSMTLEEGKIFSTVLMICMVNSPHKPTMNLEQFALMKATGSINELLSK